MRNCRRGGNLTPMSAARHVARVAFQCVRSQPQGKIESSGFQQSRKFRFYLRGPQVAGHRRRRNPENRGSQPSRCLPTSGLIDKRSAEPPVVCSVSRAGVAPGAVAQSRSDGVGAEAIGGCPPVTQNPWVFPERQEGIVLPGSMALVEPPSEPLGLSNAKIAGPLLPGVPNGFCRVSGIVQAPALASRMASHKGGPGRSKNPSIQ